jgi:phospholipid/cholesterol/gamma-HCH transport system substrate-binding protein
MTHSSRDLMVGLFVLAGLLSIAYLSISVGGASFQNTGGIEIVALFDEVGSLKPRAPVVIGGVKVGRVKAIDLDPDLRARVLLDVSEGVQLPVDTSASILTSGVLGDQYIALEPGAEEATLKAGDEIVYTQSAVVLERLIGRVIQNLGADSE